MLRKTVVFRGDEDRRRSSSSYRKDAREVQPDNEVPAEKWAERMRERLPLRRHVLNSMAFMTVDGSPFSQAGEGRCDQQGSENIAAYNLRLPLPGMRGTA